MKTSNVILFLHIFALAQVSTEATSWSEAQASLNQYREKVNSCLQTALTGDLAVLAQTTASLYESTISNGTAVITAKYQEYMTEYNDIKQSAQEAGINIATCIDRFDKLISNLGPENVDELTNCVNAEKDLCVDYVSQQTVNLVDRYWSTVFENEKFFLSCAPSDEDCLSNVASSLLKVTGRVEGYINSEVSRTMASFQGYHLGQFNTCGQKYVSINEGKGRSLLDGFKTCVDEQQ